MNKKIFKVKTLITIIFLATVLSCKKDSPPYPDFGCMHGTRKSTGRIEFIACWHREIYLAGDNQVAADNIADNFKIPHVNVSIVDSFKDITFEKNEQCSCH